MALARQVRPVFSHDIFATQRYGGISRYYAELHRALRARGVRSAIAAPIWRAEALRRLDGVWGVRAPQRLDRHGAERMARAAGQLLGPLTLRYEAMRHAGLVLHQTYFSPALPTTDVPVVITVYDMIHERFPQLFPAEDMTHLWKRQWCERADTVIVISDHTRQQILDHYDLDPSKVAVCHLGVATRTTTPAPPVGPAAAGPYLLYVGDRSPYKNFDRLVAAFLRTDAAQEGVRLIAFGGLPPTRAELDRLSEVGRLDNVSFVRGNDAALAAHYGGALALVYPSLEEGFGLPLLEAMTYGCPVAAADAGAIPEVSDGAALLFDPTDAASIRSSLDLLVSDTALRCQLVERGRPRAAQFTWDATAARTLQAYTAALERSRLRR